MDIHKHYHLLMIYTSKEKFLLLVVEKTKVIHNLYHAQKQLENNLFVHKYHSFHAIKESLF